MQELLNLLNFVLRDPLNRAAKLSSISRFTRWQVGSRIPGQPIPIGAEVRVNDKHF